MTKLKQTALTLVTCLVFTSCPCYATDAANAMLDQLVQKLVSPAPRFDVASSSQVQIPPQTASIENAANTIIHDNYSAISRFLQINLNAPDKTETPSGSVMFSRNTQPKASLYEQSKGIPAQLLNRTLGLAPITTPTQSNFLQMLDSPFGIWLLISSNVLHTFEKPNLNPLKSDPSKRSKITKSDLYKSIISGQAKSHLLKQYSMSQTLELANKLSAQAEQANAFRLKDDAWKQKIEQASLLEINREMLKVLVEMREELYKTQLEQTKNRLALTMIQEELNQLNESGLMQMKEALDYKIKPPF